MNVSVIVPVYNVEPYIEACLDSVLPALRDTDEVLLVQGHSTDRSRERSAQYQSRYPQVQVLEQDGKGLSNARNCGLRAAKGDFILFVDSDDYVDPNALSSLLAQVCSGSYSADLWLTDYYKHFESSGQDKLICQIGTQQLCSMDSLAQVLPKCQCFWNIWKNIYRREFLLENELFFSENTYAEDIDFMTRLFLAEPTIQTADTPFYHYRIDRGGSLMNEVPLERIQDTVAVLESSIEMLKASGASWVAPVISGFQFEYLLNLALIQETVPGQRRAAANSFASYRKTLSLGNDQVVHCAAFGLRLIGIQNMSRLMRLVKRLKRKREHRTL